MLAASRITIGSFPVRTWHRVYFTFLIFDWKHIILIERLVSGAEILITIKCEEVSDLFVSCRTECWQHRPRFDGDDFWFSKLRWDFSKFRREAALVSSVESAEARLAYSRQSCFPPRFRTGLDYLFLIEDGSPDTRNIWQSMAQNPHMLQQMLQAPYMQTMLQGLAANPQLAQQVGKLLQNLRFWCNCLVVFFLTLVCSLLCTSLKWLPSCSWCPAIRCFRRTHSFSSRSFRWCRTICSRYIARLFISPPSLSFCTSISHRICSPVSFWLC